MDINSTFLAFTSIHYTLDQFIELLRNYKIKQQSSHNHINNWYSVVWIDQKQTNKIFIILWSDKIDRIVMKYFFVSFWIINESIEIKQVQKLYNFQVKQDDANKSTLLNLTKF